MKEFNEVYHQQTEPLGSAAHMCRIRWITSQEHTLLWEHLRANKPSPSLHPEFYNHRNFRKKTHKFKGGSSWWQGVKGNERQIRLFILKMRTITRVN